MTPPCTVTPNERLYTVQRYDSCCEDSAVVGAIGSFGVTLHRAVTGWPTRWGATGRASPLLFSLLNLLLNRLLGLCLPNVESVAQMWSQLSLATPGTSPYNSCYSTLSFGVTLHGAVTRWPTRWGAPGLASLLQVQEKVQEKVQDKVQEEKEQARKVQ